MNKNCSNIPQLCLFPIILAGFVAGSIEGYGQTSPPNIVFIYADDLGWSDVGYRCDDSPGNAL